MTRIENRGILSRTAFVPAGFRRLSDPVRRAQPCPCPGAEARRQGQG